MKIRYGRTWYSASRTGSVLEVTARYGHVYFGDAHDCPEELTPAEAKRFRRKLLLALDWAIARAERVSANRRNR